MANKISMPRVDDHNKTGEDKDKADKTEDQDNNTGPDALPTDEGVILMLWLSADDPSDQIISCWGWSASRTILLESKELLSSHCGSDTSLGNLEDLSSTDTKEVEGLHKGSSLNDSAAQQPAKNAVDLLQDHMGLQEAHKELILRARAGGLDPVLSGHVEAMKQLLNLYLDKELGYTWIKASQVVAKSEGRGTTCAQSIQSWVIKFVGMQELLCHQHGRTQLSVLNDENVTHLIKEALGERAKNGFLSATDVVEVVSSLEIQAQLLQAGIDCPSISKSMACCWLKKLGWCHGRHQNGMYADGHEWKDIVEYRTEFVEQFAQYERHSTLGTMKGQSSRHHLCLQQSATFLSSSSPTMNPHSTKTTNAKFIGAVQARM